MSFFNKSRIEKFSSVANCDLLNAFELAKNSSTVSAEDKRNLVRFGRLHLLATSHESRMIWGRRLSHYLSEKFCVAPGVTHENSMFLVTLCDISCVTSVSDRKPAIASFKARLSRGLRGLSYLGNLEPAYYTNVQAGSRIDGKKCIFWHLHLIVWDVSKRDLRGHLDDLERSRKYLAITDQFPGVHMKKIKQGELANTVGYIFKPPANAYRLSLYDSTQYGLPVTMARQGKQRLRPGERVRIFHVMKEISLPDLAVASGDGTPLLNAARKSARDECGYTKMRAKDYARSRAIKQQGKSVAMGDTRQMIRKRNL
jgi:hypothetical protein